MGLEAGLGEALRADCFLLRGEFTPARLDYLERTRRFVHEDVLPVVNGYWERAEVPWPLIKKLGAAGLVGDGIPGHRTAVALLAAAGFALAGLLATRVVPPGPPHPRQPQPHNLFRHHAGGVP